MLSRREFLKSGRVVCGKTQKAKLRVFRARASPPHFGPSAWRTLSARHPREVVHFLSSQKSVALLPEGGGCRLCATRRGESLGAFATLSWVCDHSAFSWTPPAAWSLQRGQIFRERRRIFLADRREGPRARGPLSVARPRGGPSLRACVKVTLRVLGGRKRSWGLHESRRRYVYRRATNASNQVNTCAKKGCRDALH